MDKYGVDKDGVDERHRENQSVSLPSKTPNPTPDLPIFRLSVAQYQQMVQAGILTANDPVELLGGWLVTKMPKSPRHTTVTRLVVRGLEPLLPTDYFLSSQEPLTTETSEPEPDVMVVRGDITDYAERHPQGRDVALVIEVSDATLARDRGLKRGVYARALVPIYWIINLVDNRVEVYREPSEDDYASVQRFFRGDRVPVVVDGESIAELDVVSFLRD
ncbi:MAG: Uma2 family endonuclease [Trueperaceae bacterium]|nr:Uma2 family endonuclease [Trueperaceae bacterium]